MKALGIMLVGALAVAGGIAAATYITKKKLEKENEDNYYDDWDSDDIDDDWDFDFDEDMEVEGEPALAETKIDAAPQAASIPEVPASPFGGVFAEDSGDDDDDEEL